LSTCGIDWLTEDIDSTIIAEGRPELRRALDNIRFQKQGSSRTLGLNINWIKLPDSQRSELLIIGSDITERKRAEDELRAKTAFLEAQIQATIDAILIVDEQASVIWKNQRFIQLFDVP
jgi:PAS domain-containing protein